MLIELLFRLFLGDAVSLLDFAEKLIALSSNDSQIIVGEFAPFLLNRALELLPVSRHLIPVHDLSPLPQYLLKNLLQRLLLLHHGLGHHQAGLFQAMARLFPSSVVDAGTVDAGAVCACGWSPCAHTAGLDLWREP
jgi:hypothetical protein